MGKFAGWVIATGIVSAAVAVIVVRASNKAEAGSGFAKLTGKG